MSRRNDVTLIAALFHFPGWQRENVEQGSSYNIGKNQLYKIGVDTRTRYKSFLNELYKREEIVVRSTDVGRTIMSAELFLAGLYPPKNDQVWNPTLNWQPIPVHKLNYNQVTKSKMQALITSCSTISKYEDRFYQENKGLIDCIQESSGLTYRDCVDMNFYSVMDSLVTEKYYGLLLPYGLDDCYEEIKNLKDSMMVRLFASYEVIIINGPLFQDVIDALNSKRNNTLKQKAYAYFLHDTNLLPFLAAVTHATLTSPPFAASISIKLYKPSVKSTDDFNVKVYYTPTPESSPELQYIKGCGRLCPLDKFTELLKMAMSSSNVQACPCTIE